MADGPPVRASSTAARASASRRLPWWYEVRPVAVGVIGPNVDTIHIRWQVHGVHILPPGRAGHGRSFGEIMMVVSQLQDPIDVRPGDRGRHRIRWTVLALSCLAVAAFFSGQYAQGNLDTLARSHVGLAGTYAHRPV